MKKYLDYVGYPLFIIKYLGIPNNLSDTLILPLIHLDVIQHYWIQCCMHESAE